jgi:hypothetical protein
MNFVIEHVPCHLQGMSVTGTFVVRESLNFMLCKL